MKKALTILFAGLMLCMATPSKAQLRYIDTVFSDVTFTDSVAYTANWSILPWRLGLISDTIIIPQFMDIYAPMGDTATNRPVVLMGVTGTFFPAFVNGGFTGERSDAFFVDFATDLAKRGYVVGVVQYRRGWLAGSSALNQTRTILHAAYRGIQDMRAAVRYLKATVAGGNPWGIDTSRIAVGGHGTGAYVSYGATYLKRFDQTLLPKFIEFDSAGNGTPFLDEDVFGDPYGVDTATLNNPTNPTFSSDFKLGFGLSGALGDSSWVEAGDVPFIAMHSYRDPGAPYDVGDVIAIDGTDGTPFAVIPGGAGGLSVVRRATRLGNQTIFENAPFVDDISKRAEAMHPEAAGLYTFVTPFTPGDAMCDGVGVTGDTLTEWGGPYTYFDSTAGVDAWNDFWALAIMAGLQVDGEQSYCRNTRGVPSTAAAAAPYIDTVMAFMVPRLAIGLALPNNVGIRDLLLDASNIKVFPNPSANRMRVLFNSADNDPIDEIRLLDISGRLVRTYKNVRTNDFEIDKGELSPGLYMLQIQVGDKMGNKKIMFN